MLPSKTKEKYLQKWLVYDCDGHNDFVESINKARDYGFNVAFSNMCIEYWFALHFHDLDGEPIPQVGCSHSQAQINLINRGIEVYNRRSEHKVKSYDSNTKSVNEDFFDLMMASNPDSKTPRVIEAYKRAKTIHLRKKGQGSEFRESVTTVYELLKELGVVIEKEDGDLKLNI